MTDFVNTRFDYAIPNLSAYLVVDPDGGPPVWAGLNRTRAYELAGNTGCCVVRLDVVTDKREEAR